MKHACVKALATAALLGIGATSASTAATVANGLTMNGLTMNGLTMNGLVANGLATNGLSGNGTTVENTAGARGEFHPVAVILKDGKRFDVRP
jgi:hypothetical protein